ncbi:hypothetical protein BU15DRAFT_87418 [Melanogaster broomeanus]|nr:hypothetical protein BU15DRAFT_87418 [Melanogaster broomeanus]
MASDTSSSTPPALTPDYTGSGSGDSSPQVSEAAVRKARRQTAFYPNMNSSNKPVKPFSRSAAKRQSVMTLGSIEHLQHYFTKTGIAAKSNPSKKLMGQFVPAIGPSALTTTKASLGSVLEFELPPSPAIPEIRQPAFSPHVRAYETDPVAFLPGVVEDLATVAHAWGIQSNSGDMNGNPTPDANHLSPIPSSSPPTAHAIDVLSILKTTTRAIRSVRNYVIALPDESAGTLRTQYRSTVAASPPLPKRSPAQPKPQADPLSLIRKSALEVLAALRELEERSRVPLSDEAYDAQSDLGSLQGPNSHSRGASPSAVSDDDPDLPHIDPDMSISFVQVQGRYESVPVWEDENDYDSHNLSDEEREKREHWDDRLVLGGGWLYKQDVKLKDLGKEKEVVRRYVGLVDDVLFGGVKDGKRGWERERERAAKREGRVQNRRVSAGDVDTFRFPPETPRSGRRAVSSSGLLDSMRSMSLSEEPEEMETLSEGESVDEDDIPEWANYSLFVDDSIGRAHALLRALLSGNLRSSAAVRLQTDPLYFVSYPRASLLCVAYNTGVRRSRKPWGYISVDSIHDITSLAHSADARSGWTFRRTGQPAIMGCVRNSLRIHNLVPTDRGLLLFDYSALKLRYLLPLLVPSAPSRPDHIPRSASPARTHPRGSKIRFATSEPPLTFDPRLVARKDDGWEVMLELLC